MSNVPPPTDARHAPEASTRATIVLSESLELRAQTFVHVGDGHAIGVDLRLYRRTPSDFSAAAFSPTGAGFRIPVDRIPELCGRLLALANVATGRHR